jgi:hypothetical protein
MFVTDFPPLIDLLNDPPPNPISVAQLSKRYAPPVRQSSATPTLNGANGLISPEPTIPVAQISSVIASPILDEPEGSLITRSRADSESSDVPISSTPEHPSFHPTDFVPAIAPSILDEPNDPLATWTRPDPEVSNVPLLPFPEHPSSYPIDLVPAIAPPILDEPDNSLITWSIAGSESSDVPLPRFPEHPRSHPTDLGLAIAPPILDEPNDPMTTWTRPDPEVSHVPIPAFPEQPSFYPTNFVPAIPHHVLRNPDPYPVSSPWELRQDDESIPSPSRETALVLIYRDSEGIMSLKPPDEIESIEIVHLRPFYCADG